VPYEDRQYQIDLDRNIFDQWDSGIQNVCAVLATGGGKTHIFTGIMQKFIEGLRPQYAGPACAIAHRQELVSQTSLTLARRGIRHRIVAPKAIIKHCVRLHIAHTGADYYNPRADASVAGVDTIIRRKSDLGNYFKTVRLWVQDEGHHVLRTNKWGKAVELFPNALGLGVTATFIRTDGKGLGRTAQGVFDSVVEGPSMRELISLGYLTDYRIYAPVAELDLTDNDISSSTGDYIQARTAEAVANSSLLLGSNGAIHGDIVSHYLRFAPGERGVTFVPTVKIAAEVSAQYNSAGVPSEVISAKTPDNIRTAAVQRLADGQLKQLVNVDIFCEGFDLPAIEVVSMARPTESYSLYAQQFGRALRPCEGKTHAKIIDHVGNVERHRLPDVPRVWPLLPRPRGHRSANTGVTPVRNCVNPECVAPYERHFPACPYCGTEPVPSDRSDPKFVDGDLTELDPETLRRMRGEVEKMNLDPEIYRAQLASQNVPTIGQMANVKRHRSNQDAQTVLREMIALWAGWQRTLERSDRESYRRFYHKFGIDVMSAQALKRKDAEQLTIQVSRDVYAIATGGSL